MSENKKQLLDRLAKSVESLDELESEKLVSFGEGMAFVKNNTVKAEPEKESA